MDRSVVFIILLPQKEKPQALTAVLVSNFDKVVPVSQSQYRRLLSAEPEMNLVVSPVYRVKDNWTCFNMCEYTNKAHLNQLDYTYKAVA